LSNNAKNAKKLHLVHAAFIDYVFALHLDVHQHLWDSSGDEVDIHKGQAGEEDVHGLVQVEV
jgi:hypothetical protein